MAWSSGGGITECSFDVDARRPFLALALEMHPSFLIQLLKLFHGASSVFALDSMICVKQVYTCMR